MELATRCECPRCFEGNICIKEGINNSIILYCPMCLNYEEHFSIDAIKQVI